MTESRVVEVLIVGAGPAGLSVAAECAYHGVGDVLLLEKGPSHNQTRANARSKRNRSCQLFRACRSIRICRSELTRRVSRAASSHSTKPTARLRLPSDCGVQRRHTSNGGNDLSGSRGHAVRQVASTIAQDGLPLAATKPQSSSYAGSSHLSVRARQELGEYRVSFGSQTTTTCHATDLAPAK